MDVRFYLFLFGVIGYLWIFVVFSLRLIRSYFVKRFLMVVLFFYVGMFYVGVMIELCNFGELIFIVLMVFLLLLCELLKLEAVMIGQYKNVYNYDILMCNN